MLVKEPEKHKQMFAKAHLHNFYRPTTTFHGGLLIGFNTAQRTLSFVQRGGITKQINWTGMEWPGLAK